MATQTSKPSRPVGSPTTPTAEESVTPDSQPSGLGALSTSMSTEPERKTEAIQRAQIGSLMGANGNNEPQNKSPKRQTPAWGARPKRYALEMWVEIDTGAGIHAAPEEDSYSVDFAIDCISRAYPGCTGMYLGVAGHMLAFYGKKTNPRAGLLLDQAITASKAIANIPTWMGYFATWRVKCISTSEAGESSPQEEADAYGHESSQEDDEGLYIPSYLQEAIPNDPVLQVKMAHAMRTQEVETRRCFTCNQPGHLQRDHWKYEEKNGNGPLQLKGPPQNKLAPEKARTPPVG